MTILDRFIYGSTSALTPSSENSERKHPAHLFSANGLLGLLGFAIFALAPALPATAATPVNSAPRFTTQPASRTTSAGATISFSTVFSGTPAPTVEWFKNGSLYSGTGTTSATSTSATLTISNVQAVDAGTYVAVATNSFSGTANTVTSSPAFLTVSTSVPFNNSFSSSITLSGATMTFSGTNVGASRETSEPRHAGNAGGKSVWWNWSTSVSGTVSISTAGSSFDTLLGVYTGTTVNALTTVASNDDVATGSLSSRVSFPATAGTLYRIAVDGFSGTSGTVSLSLNLVLTPPLPANNNFAAAFTLSGATVTTSGTNGGTSKEAGEPRHAGNAGGKSVWWSWTATGSGTVTISTAGSSFDTLLGVYTGATVNALTTVASNDDVATGSHSSLVSFPAIAGTAYNIAVDGFSGTTGTISLSINLTATPPPANDSFASRIVLRGSTVTTSGSNINATKETGEFNHAGNAGGRSVWWSWTASASGTVTVSTAGSKFTTLLGIYTGTTTVSALTSVVSTSSGLATFAATIGTTYQLAVDGFGAANGGIKLSVSGPPVAPAPAAIPSGLTVIYKPASAGSPAAKNSTSVNLQVNATTGLKPPLASVTIVGYEAASLRDVAWNGSLYVAVGNGGIILTSSDGVTWYPRNSGTTASLLAVVWDGAEWVVVGTLPDAGSSGITLTSPNGINWSVSSP